MLNFGPRCSRRARGAARPHLQPGKRGIMGNINGGRRRASFLVEKARPPPSRTPKRFPNQSGRGARAPTPGKRTATPRTQARPRKEFQGARVRRCSTVVTCCDGESQKQEVEGFKKNKK